MADQPALNTMSFAAKPVMLDVIRHERQKFYDLLDEPANWNVQSRCTEWETRDIVGHMIDVTEGYLERWGIARQGGTGENYGLPAMADRANERAQAFRSLPRGEAISRLQKSSDELLAILDAVGEDEWSNFLVPHAYMGPLPTLFYFSFQIMDYGVHSWDIRYGLGDTLGVLEERTAGVLVPYMFVLMSATVDGPSAAGLRATYGIEVAGEWGGKWRVNVADGAFTYAPEEQDFLGCQALFQFDPSNFVLSSFLRFPGGAASGDPDVIERVRHMFFRI